MVRTPCCKEKGIKKGAWTSEEDQKLIAYIQLHGEGGWRTLPEKAGLKRCGKSCRLRWANYLRPDIKRGEFSPEEDDTIIKLHALMGNKWAAIATTLAGRTDNEIKNYWNTNLKKRLKLNNGFHPITHTPIIEPTFHKPVGSSHSAWLLNRVASKYAVDLNRDIVTGIIIGNATINVEDSQKSGEVNSQTETSNSKLLNLAATSIMLNTASESSAFPDDDLTEFFSNEEISKNVEHVGLMEELNGILNYSGAGAGNIKEYSTDHEMEFLGYFNEEDDMDLDKYVWTSLDSKVGV